MMFDSKFEELCYQAYTNGMLIDSLTWIDYPVIEFRDAFSRMSKEIKFKPVKDIVKTSHGFVGKNTSHINPHIRFENIPKYHLYLPKNYTNELREANIDICLNASLQTIKEITSNRYWLYYIDVIQDLLYSPSGAYRELVENWALQLMDLSHPESLIQKRIKEDILPMARRNNKFSFPKLYIMSYYQTDFKDNSYMI